MFLERRSRLMKTKITRLVCPTLVLVQRHKKTQLTSLVAKVSKPFYSKKTGGKKKEEEKMFDQSLADSIYFVHTGFS